MKPSRHEAAEELSAYLDGESRRARAVETHLRTCPECADRYRRLARVSAAIRALPATEPHPAFRARVMARVAETVPTHPRPWPRPWHIAAGAMAAAALVAVLAGLWMAAPPPDTPRGMISWAQADPQHLEAELARRLARHPDPFHALADDPLWMGASHDDVPDEILVAELVGAPWFDDFARALDETRDVDDLVLSLSEDEAESFRSLLMAYANEG